MPASSAPLAVFAAICRFCTLVTKKHLNFVSVVCALACGLRTNSTDTSIEFLRANRAQIICLSFASVYVHARELCVERAKCLRARTLSGDTFHLCVCVCAALAHLQPQNDKSVRAQVLSGARVNHPRVRARDPMSTLLISAHAMNVFVCERNAAALRRVHCAR